MSLPGKHLFSRNTSGVALLIIIAVASWYLARTLSSSRVEVRKTEVAQSGFYLKSARILGTGLNGQPLYQIEAGYAVQQENNELEFENVEILYTSEAEVPWTISADRAMIGDNRDLVVLTGHVIASSSEGFSGDTTEIRTQYLELAPDSFSAQTDERVQIRIGSRSLTATGMLALLQTNQLQLKSNVSGKFAP